MSQRSIVGPRTRWAIALHVATHILSAVTGIAIPTAAPLEAAA